MNARQTTVLIVFPMDPLGSKVGGAEAFLKSWIRAAPPSWTIEFVGVHSSPDPMPIGQWHDIDIGQRKIRFMPVCRVEDENKRRWLPLSLKFTLALCRRAVDTADRVLLFNRLEPAVLFLRRPNPKIVIVHSDLKHQHARGRSEVFWRFMPGFFHRLESLILHRLHAAYTVSRGTLEHWEQAYPRIRERFHLVAGCVDTERFRPASGPKGKLKEALARELPVPSAEAPWILFVGRLQAAKAPERVIEIGRQYLRHHAGAKFILIGDGNLREELQERIRAHALEDSIVLLGSLDSEVLRRFYQAADVLLLTSHYEGMPLTVLEALACGLPVVATDVGELDGVIDAGRTGELISPYCPRAMASMIARVLSEPQTYSASRCENAAAHFTPRQVFAGMYREIDAIDRPRAAMAYSGNA